ncbi:MAG: TolC family protein [Fibrella sp.]|nr:TolC family protein [Armatimonadota bacterium]
MRASSVLYLSFCTLGTLTSPAVAQLPTVEQASPTVRAVTTIDDAVAFALRASPIIKIAAATRNAAAARVGIARAETRPTLSANTFVSGGTLPNIVQSPSLPVSTMIMGLPKGGYIDQNLMFMYPLYTGGRLAAMVRQAEAMRETSEAEREAKRQEVALLVRVAYRETLARRAATAASRTTLVASEERLRADRVRAEKGSIPAYFVSQDESEVATSRQAVAEAERDAELSLAALKTAMGVPLTARLALVENIESRSLAALVSEIVSPLGASQDATVEALVRRAQEERTELAALAYRVSGARDGESVVRSQFRPQVNAFVMGDVFRGERQSGGTGITYGITASVPLIDGGSQRARRDEARAMREEQEAEGGKLLLEIGQEVNEAYLRAATAEQSIISAQAALASAQEAYKAADARYQAGRSVLSELLSVSAIRTRAESAVTRAVLEGGIAHDQLRRAVGVILPRSSGQTPPKNNNAYTDE